MRLTKSHKATVSYILYLEQYHDAVIVILPYSWSILTFVKSCMTWSTTV